VCVCVFLHGIDCLDVFLLVVRCGLGCIGVGLKMAFMSLNAAPVAQLARAVVL
jgi:hypothetical protein